MGSSNYYKIWLRDTGASTWREVSKFTDLTFSYTLNAVPQMSATFYLDDSNIQDLMVAGTPIRITGTDSDDGTVEKLYFGDTTGTTGAVSGSREIWNGKMLEPSGQEKTDQRNSKPVTWSVEGRGYHKDANVSIRDATGNRSNSAGTVLSNYISSDSSSDLGTGTLDTGPNINVKHRKDKIYEAAIDICQVGDGTDKFTYYAHVDADGSFNPRFNYYSPTHSETDWSFETSDPTGGTDDARVLDQDSDLRSFEQINEDKRIRNAVKVRWAGLGVDSSQSQQETSFNTDSTSISNFGRQEEIIYAPWVLDSSTATTLRDTVLDMYKGTDFNGNYEGIKRYRLVLKDAGMFRSDFDATLGDMVAVEKGSTTKAIGRFLKYEYEQMREALTIELGIPRMPLEDVARTSRRNRQAVNSINVTQAPSQRTIGNNERAGNIVLDKDLDQGDTTNFSNPVDEASRPNFGESIHFTGISGDATQLGYAIELRLQLNSFYDGGLDAHARFIDSGSALITTLIKTYPTMVDGVPYAHEQFYMYALAGSGSWDELELLLTDRNTGASDANIDLTTSHIKISEVPQLQIPSHTHNL